METPHAMTRDEALALDDADPLAAHRRAFTLPEGVIYLDGNSLGALPRATSARVREVVEREWGDGLIRSWNSAHWTDLPRRIGAKIARLIGARAHEVICSDSTSINLFKVLAAALHLQAARPQVSLVGRRVILSERANFPTDLYVAQGLAHLLGDHELRLSGPDEILAAIDGTVAVVFLTHVNFRTGAMHDMAAITRRAHECGALVVWDLAHSAGAVPVDLESAHADFAVGCGYKYLNGGPGAPAFVYAAERHLAALAGETYAQPLTGWFGHATPFEFVTDYAPAATIDRFSVGTPPIIALAALDAGVDTVLAAGIDALRTKSVALTERFIAVVEAQCDAVTLASPREARRRGSQVCFVHAEAYAVMQALIERGVIGDFRAPDVLRFGLAPLYVRYVDVFDAAATLAEVLRTGTWRDGRFRQRAAVT
jgi:kynureninase